ncbi:MAG: hypothetical protein COW00_16895 [Bdellovibrio sp. CG12_big_fil_rev_8_21_14_0_65_39_13]|nr:MAG: hypothetical protein COW78_11620 [Bdellovibrio sp. CG22_combo_CG10-13_8_21_14_all_39_27]PIQ58199.1 MAG: hypothetical protein COW00_16895 [Bdellovibrio sp. CG12_big_fil_rev_8_21_14_0_65_39_13]PIR35289.1 MAG: hypothetical protein COV37_09335 [Bdellovibrio sp. CG11_big_fil_rev_8_21_14_0_20_39_38]
MRISNCFYVFLIISKALFAQDMVELYKAQFKTEDQVLDYLVREYIPTISLERPHDRELLKQQLKAWNPHIKDWTDIRVQDKINVYKKKYFYDIHFGYHAYDNTEKLIGNGAINTKNFGPTASLRITHTKDINSYTFFEYKLLKKNDFLLLDNNKIYAFPANHNFEVGYNRGPRRSSWSFGVGAAYEEVSYLSFNNERFKVKSIILDNLQVSTVRSAWGTIDVSYRIPFIRYGTYLTLQFGRSFWSEKALDDGSLKERMSGQRVEGILKFYFWKNMWIKAYYMAIQTQGNTKIDHTQTGAHVGFTF